MVDEEEYARVSKAVDFAKWLNTQASGTIAIKHELIVGNASFPGDTLERDAFAVAARPFEHKEFTQVAIFVRE